MAIHAFLFPRMGEGLDCSHDLYAGCFLCAVHVNSLWSSRGKQGTCELRISPGFGGASDFQLFVQFDVLLCPMLRSVCKEPRSVKRVFRS